MPHAQNCFCAECRGEAPSGEALDRERGACHRPVVCAACGRFHGDCDLLAQRAGAEPPQNETNGEEQMLPSPTQAGQKTQGASGGGRARGQRQGPPFLKVENLTAEPKRAKILGVRTQDVGFNDLIAKVSLGGTAYFLGMKTSYQPFHALHAAFGADENDWVGREFLIQTTFDEFSEQQRMFVIAPAPDVAGKKKAGA
jgi:hypothetical protein